MSAKVAKFLSLMLLAVLIVLGLLTGRSALVFAQQEGAQLIDSLEEHQKRLDELIRGRLRSVVPSGNFILRILVVGKDVEIERPARGGDTGNLPGFRRGTVQPKRTVHKFRIDQINVRIVVNEDLAPSEQEYIRTVVPLLADFREDRADQLDLQVVPPATKDGEPFGFAAGLDLDMRDWLLLGLLGVILLLLLIVLIRVLITPKPRRYDPYESERIRPPPPRPTATPPAQSPQPSAAAATAATAAPGSPEEQQANQQLELERQLDTLKHAVVKGLFARADIGRELIQLWIDQPSKVGGLLYALGHTVGRQALLPHLDRVRFQALEDSVRDDTPPTLEGQIELLREANLFLVARDFVNPEEIRPDPFEFLAKLSRGQVSHLIAEEPMRIKAIVLSRIDPWDTAQILDSMSKDLQLEVAVQIGNFQSLPLDMAENVARDLAVKARGLPDAKTVDIQGTRKLVELMARTSHDTSRYLLNAIKSKDTELSEAVEKRFFMFDAIPLVPPELLPQVVRALPSNTIIQALQGADPEIQRQVIMAFPEQARSGLVTTLRASQYDEETVLEARQEVVGGFQSLAEQGKIDLRPITEAFQAKAS